MAAVRNAVTPSGADERSIAANTAFRWVADPEFDGDPPACPKCGAATEAMRCEPDRSENYMTHIALCTGKGCRMAWPYTGARALRKRRDAA